MSSKTIVLGIDDIETVEFPLRERELSKNLRYCGDAHGRAKQKSGEFKVYVVASSSDIWAAGMVTI